MDNTIRAALVNVIKVKRMKMSRAQRSRGVKTQRWLYPLATEARYGASIRAWLRPMREYVHNYIKENHEEILRGDSIDFRADSADDISVTRLDAVPGKTFKTMIDSLNGWLGQYVPEDNEAVSGSAIYMGLGKIADSVFDFNEGQYEKGAKTTFGVEFPVGEDWWPDARDTWANNNYQLIRSDMQKYISQINHLTEQAVTTGATVKSLREQIRKLDDSISKSRADFLARDQIGKLNGQITQMRMESIGLTMYVWETAGDERVRSTHRPMDGALCRWDDSTVLSDDDGKTWKDRPMGAVQLHPGQDYQCRCTATAYWQELVGEADAQIDLLSENDNNIPNTDYMGLNVMNPPSARSNKETVQQQAEAREAKRLADNAKKAKATADQLFPNEQWKPVEDRIFLSPNRPIGAKSSYGDELRDAQILRGFGSTIYLVPEIRRASGKKFDAIVNGLMFEFKNISGNENTLQTQFLRSRSQAPNVFINLETSDISRRQIMSALYGARNRRESTKSHGYNHYNKFKGGRIILKIKGQEKLIYLNVDDLKLPR